MRGLRLFVALTAAAAMMISLPAAASAQGGNAYEDAVIADGAIAYWSLGDSSGTTATDATGNNDADYEGTPGLGASGLALGDDAVDFDGDDDIVKVPNSAAINTGGPYEARTIELWFNADVTFRRQVLFEEGGGSRGISMYVYQNRVYVNAWNKKNDDATTPWGPKWLSAPIEADTTYHLAMTMDAASGKLKGYINGSPFGQATGVGKLYKHAAKIGIGAMWDDVRYHNANITNNNTRNHFDGEIDNVAIYDVALSQSDIASHTAIGGLTVGVAPNVSLVSPAAASTVSGDSVLIEVSASDNSDDRSELTANFRIDGGDWQTMSYNSESENHEGTWDASGYSEGNHTIQVRVFDTDMASKAKSHQVVVDNVSDYGDMVISDGAVAYWQLNDSSGTTAVDEVGSLDGTYTNGPVLGVSGLIPSDNGSAVDFDGENDYVSLPNGAVLNSGGPYTARTIELWFEADDVNTRQVIFEEGGLTRGMSIYLDGGSVYMNAWNTLNDDEDSPWGPIWVSAPVDANEAYNLAMVLNAGNGTLKGYLNGSLVETATGVGALFKHSAKVGLGAMNDDTRFHDGSTTDPNQDYHFDGEIDDVSVYNTALSTTKLEDHASEGGMTVGEAPSLDIENPTDSDTVSGSVEIMIHSYDNVDPDGSLDVQWRIDGGTWMGTVWEGGGEHYEADWDTTLLADGSYTLEVRSLDSDRATALDLIVVDVDNSSQYAALVASDGAVAHWRLGESSGTIAQDAVGAHDATYVGGPTLGVTSLLSNETDTAVDFDGVDDYVAIDNATDINSGGPWGGRTIELWFDADDISTRQVLFEEGGVSRGLSIYLYNDTLYATAWNTPNDDATSPWGPVTVSTTGFSANIWWHVVVVMDEANNELVLYLDGSEADTGTGVGNLFKHVAKVGLGAMSDDVVFFDGSVTNAGVAYHFNGTLDEVSIYNTALTSSDVFDHFVAGAGLPLDKL